MIGLLQRCLCLLGRHRRDGRKIWHDGDTWRSQCRGCGVQMKRQPGGWILLARPTSGVGGKSGAAQP